MKTKITINRPNLSESERSYRMEQIKQATIKFHREVAHEKTKLQKKTT